jgi:hypothetical protein
MPRALTEPELIHENDALVRRLRELDVLIAQGQRAVDLRRTELNRIVEQVSRAQRARIELHARLRTVAAQVRQLRDRQAYDRQHQNYMLAP